MAKECLLKEFWGRNAIGDKETLFDVKIFFFVHSTVQSIIQPGVSPIIKQAVLVENKSIKM